VSDSEQNPPESDFYSEYYRDRPRPDRPRRSRESPLAGLQARASAWVGRPGLFGQMRVRIGALVAVAVAAGFIIWAAVGGGGGSSSSTPAPASGNGTVAGTGPVALSLSGLRTLGAQLRQPIYWLGVRNGELYELRQLANGYVFMRYLPAGVKAGDPRALLTVGTYPMANAYSITQGLSKRPGAVPLSVQGGAGFYTKSNPRDAYVAFSGSDYQIEVWAPTPGFARRAVAQGAVASVPGTGGGLHAVESVTPAQLATLAKSLGQPIYWAGRGAPGVTYEVRQTATGIYLRYLPKGVAVGDPGAYRTIATYPLANAYDATQRIGQGKTAIQLPGGGIAVYDKKSPKASVYVAFRGSPYQIEVFDPTPGAARRLVAADKIAAVG
jgi:hypothetical protein